MRWFSLATGQRYTWLFTSCTISENFVFFFFSFALFLLSFVSVIIFVLFRLCHDLVIYQYQRMPITSLFDFIFNPSMKDSQKWTLVGDTAHIQLMKVMIDFQQVSVAVSITSSGRDELSELFLLPPPFYSSLFSESATYPYTHYPGSAKFTMCSILWSNPWGNDNSHASPQYGPNIYTGFRSTAKRKKKFSCISPISPPSCLPERRISLFSFGFFFWSPDTRLYVTWLGTKSHDFCMTLAVQNSTRQRQVCVFRALC